MILSPSIIKLAPALVKAQGEMNGAKKNAKNPHFKSDYANLEEVILCAKGPLSDNDLAFLQAPVSQAGHVGIQTIILHVSGEWIKFDPFFLPMQKFTPQEGGSLITYLKRYSLQAVLGIPSADDDGQFAESTAKANSGVISKEQVKRLYSLHQDQNYIQQVYASFGYSSANDIKYKDYDAICQALQPKPQQQQGGVL